ncbi:MAG: TIGR04084 family radical SAM/SPASM domain-containing protein [Methanosarcinaceae archaeon]|nr:TIGR04084 family radical SAM/SPASM domain-containing protein [Methanosarcinaceae archaeon]
MTNYFVTLTMNCDLECIYCAGECSDCFDDFDCSINVDYDVPEDVNYDIEIFKKFIAKDKNSNIIFYGGEPLLRTDLIMKYMDELAPENFLLHTNAIKLNILKTEYLNRLHTISVSIDGDKDLTDYYRGKGVYETIVKNTNDARSRGFTGEIIARMTVQEETDIYESVIHLLTDENLCFDSVHWQLNALFWKNDYKKRNFSKWVEESYNPGVKKLIDYWVNAMKEDKKVLRIYPFVAITDTLLKGEKTKLRCGAGWQEYNIQTDGKISPCPVMAGMSDFYVGDIVSADPKKLKEIHTTGPCLKCNIYDICGGRCLYANATMKWGEKGFEEVCKTVRFLIESLQNVLPEIKTMIKYGTIDEKDFSDYIKYNSCEIIP